MYCTRGTSCTIIKFKQVPTYLIQKHRFSLEVKYTYLLLFINHQVGRQVILVSYQFTDSSNSGQTSMMINIILKDKKIEWLMKIMTKIGIYQLPTHKSNSRVYAVLQKSSMKIFSPYKDEFQKAHKNILSSAINQRIKRKII